jgi:two-component sensor histidine kinase
VSAGVRNGRVRIELGDDGVGIPESFTVEDSTGFGMQLVGMLASQIRASVSIDRNDGTNFTIEFEK